MRNFTFCVSALVRRFPGELIPQINLLKELPVVFTLYQIESSVLDLIRSK